MYSFSEIAFFLLFFATLLLLLIFGETTVGIPVLGIVVGLCVVFVKYVQFKHRTLPSLPVILLSLFTLVTVVSIFTSVAIPLSVNNAALYVTSLVVFLFLMYRKVDWLSNQLVLGGVVVLVTLLAVLTFIYTSFAHLAVHLPSLSILTAQNGHNQSAFLFLLVLPVLWCFAERNQTRWLKLSVLTVLCGVVATFSRLGIFLSMVELLVLWQTTQNAQLKNIGKYGTLVFCCLGIVAFFLSTQFSPTHCPFAVFQDKLCKPLHTELRPTYWSQGWRAFLARPIQGWGGGTFPVLSPLFQQKSGQFSGFVHNEYLQAFAEYGMIGGAVFLSFAISVGVLAFKEIESKPNRLHFCLAIGIGSVLLASILDFGLHLSGIWVIFLVVLSCWLREVPINAWQTFRRFRELVKLTQFVLTTEFFLSSVLTLIWTSAFIVSNILWENHRVDAALDVFPFAYWKVEEVFLRENIRPQTKKLLLSLYQNQYQFLDMAAANLLTSPTEKVALLQKAITLDPLYEPRRYSYLLATYEVKNWAAFEAALMEWQNFTTQKQSSDLVYEEQTKIMKLSLDVANQSLHNDFDRSLRLYQVVYQRQPWLFTTQPVQLLEHPEQYPTELTFQFIQQIDPKYLWPYSSKIYHWELSLLQTAIDKQDFNGAEIYLTHLLKLDDTAEWQVAQVIERSILKQQSLRNNSERTTANWMGYQKLIQAWESHNSQRASFNYDIKVLVSQKLDEQNK